MKLAIVGSRSIELDPEEMKKYVSAKTEILISGGAKGVDTSIALYADKKGIKLIEIKPDYKRYGRAAPLIRNREIIEMADKVHILWDGNSKGSKFIIEECKRMDKEYEVFLL